MHQLDSIVRILVVLALIGLSVWRLVRYFRFGMAKRVTAIPPTAGMFLPETSSTSPATALAPADMQPRPSRWRAGLTMLFAWLGGNLLLAAVLFGWPALSGIPVIWRLFVQIFANFYLLPFARRVGVARYGGQRVTPPG
jgi:hypothetical protein